MVSNRLSIFGWFLVLSLSLYFIYSYALRYFNFSSPAYSPDLKPFTLALVTHISGGIVALLLGPVQFIGTIRRKRPLLHRNIGKIYLVTVLVSGLTSLYLSIGHILIKNAMVGYGTGLIGLALAWLSTSTFAFIAIKQRNVEQHREWMVRSYTVTCGFVLFRIVLELLLKNTKVRFGEAATLSAWSCWAIPLLVTEIALQARKLTSPAKNTPHKKGTTTVLVEERKF